MINLGTLKEITDLRSVWSHEALNFTHWVAENVDLLADAVGLDITVDETESSVGDFNVDIYASETGTDRKIIIENQLEDTDHDHLGKLITYASGKDADVVIWVVKHAREEHKAAVEWLNNHTDDKIGFFLCEIKLFQIGDSDIAPSFAVVERPNDWTKEIKKTISGDKVDKRYLSFARLLNIGMHLMIMPFRILNSQNHLIRENLIQTIGWISVLAHQLATSVLHKFRREIKLELNYT